MSKFNVCINISAIGGRMSEVIENRYITAKQQAEADKAWQEYMG